MIFRLHSSGALLELDPDLELGAGGEARVYALPDHDGLVAKVYHEPNADYGRKLEFMLHHPPLPTGQPTGGVRLAWPLDLLLDGVGRFAGFLMPRAEEPRIFEYYNPAARRARAPLFHYALLHRAGRNLAAAFDALHERGYVVGDVNESNLLLGADGRVTVVDTDSFQVPDGPGGRVHRSAVGKPEFTPPELQGVVLARVDRAPEHDRFGLGVLLFLLLMEGNHPFAARYPGGEAPAMADRIRAGRFPYGPRAEPGVAPPRLAPPWELLDPRLRELFTRCLVDGHGRPDARPAPGEWTAALEAAEAELATCGQNPQHRFGLHLEACPWCARARLLGGRDPFPTPEEAALIPAPAAPARRPPRAGRRPAPVLAQPRPQPAVPAPPPLPALPPLHPTLMPAVWVLPLSVFALLLPSGMDVVALFAAIWVGVRALRRSGGFVLPDWRTVGLAMAFALLAVPVSLVVRGADDSPLPSAPTPYGYDDGVDFMVSPPVEVEPLPFEPDTVMVSPEYRPGAVMPGVYEASQVDVEPELLNRDEVQALLDATYPPRLRAAGITASASLFFQVDAQGRVVQESVVVVEGTHRDFADAARLVAGLMRFRPAELNGQRVAVKVTFPVVWTLDPPRDPQADS